MISRLPSALPRTFPLVSFLLSVQARTHGYLCNRSLRPAPSKLRPSSLIPSSQRSLFLSSPRYSSSTASPPPQNGPSATAIFYRALLPSMLHCLAIGSIVYYALELVYMTLSREKQVEVLGDKVRRLEEALEIARVEPVEGVSRSTKGIEGDGKGRGKSWFKVW